MINAPVTVVEDSFQEAWLSIVKILMESQWEVRNLVVQIRDPVLVDCGLHDRVVEFSRQEGLLPPKHVAYTIFPRGLYRDGVGASAVFTAYNRENGLYDRLHRRKRDWGTYFRRMTHYETRQGVVNQLGNVINAIRDRSTLSKAAYTVVIQQPGGETVRLRGGPCLNYLAIQVEREQPLTLGLLAVYRNHDFLERAYGNYWGLCNLLVFLAKEVAGVPGPLTCVSSHAYTAAKKTALKQLVEGL